MLRSPLRPGAVAAAGHGRRSPRRRAGAARAAQPFVNIPYATWSDDEPPYRLYPGDELDVVVPSAPELNKTVTVQPDGRDHAAAGGAADGRRHAAPRELEQDAVGRPTPRQLLRPGVDVVVKAQPLKVFVGGEVGKPGVYDMPGDIDALRAIVRPAASSPAPSARRW